MKFTATYQIPARREKVFEAITDPSVLQRCIHGCEKMEKTGENSYDAHLKIGIGFLSSRAVAKVRLLDIKQPESCTLVIEGKGGPGFVNSTAKIFLTEREGESELSCDADAQIGGMIAALGESRIESKARQFLDDFFKKLAVEIRGGTSR